MRLTTVFTSIKMITISDLEEREQRLSVNSSIIVFSQFRKPCPLYNPALSSGFQHVGIVNVAVSTKDGHNT